MAQEKGPRQRQHEDSGHHNSNSTKGAAADEVRRLLARAPDTVRDSPTEDEVNLWHRVFNDHEFGEAIFQGATLGEKTVPQITDAIARLRESFAKSIRDPKYEDRLFKKLRRRRKDRHGKA
ncbi:MAG: hypothetical protein WB973_08635 [Thermoanaerobaculia bacterium]